MAGNVNQVTLYCQPLTHIGLGGANIKSLTSGGGENIKVIGIIESTIENLEFTGPISLSEIKLIESSIGTLIAPKITINGSAMLKKPLSVGSFQGQLEKTKNYELHQRSTVSKLPFE